MRGGRRANTPRAERARPLLPPAPADGHSFASAWLRLSLLVKALRAPRKAALAHTPRSSRRTCAPRSLHSFPKGARDRQGSRKGPAAAPPRGGPDRPVSLSPGTLACFSLPTRASFLRARAWQRLFRPPQFPRAGAHLLEVALECLKGLGLQRLLLGAILLLVGSGSVGHRACARPPAPRPPPLPARCDARSRRAAQASLAPRAWQGRPPAAAAQARGVSSPRCPPPPRGMPRFVQSPLRDEASSLNVLSHTCLFAAQAAVSCAELRRRGGAAAWASRRLRSTAAGRPFPSSTAMAQAPSTPPSSRPRCRRSGRTRQRRRSSS